MTAAIHHEELISLLQPLNHNHFTVIGFTATIVATRERSPERFQLLTSSKSFRRLIQFTLRRQKNLLIKPATTNAIPD